MRVYPCSSVSYFGFYPRSKSYVLIYIKSRSESNVFLFFRDIFSEKCYLWGVLWSNLLNALEFLNNGPQITQIFTEQRLYNNLCQYVKSVPGFSEEGYSSFFITHFGDRRLATTHHSPLTTHQRVWGL